MDMKIINMMSIKCTTLATRDYSFLGFRCDWTFFLLATHITHEDIDAFLGVYSKHLTQMDIYTIEGRNCYQYKEYVTFFVSNEFKHNSWRKHLGFFFGGGGGVPWQIPLTTKQLTTTTTNFISKHVILQKHCPHLARLFEAGQYAFKIWN